MQLFHKKPSSETVTPPVFVNRPISDAKNDIVGFSTQVDTICKAIENGSSMIGIVADYGTGKSSITELLSHTVQEKPYRYPAPLKVNLWDCLQNQQQNSDKSSVTEKEVSDLTKSFLYQLAGCKEKKRRFSSYINKRLSRNYGILSMNAASIKFWIRFLLSAFFYVIYAVCSGDNFPPARLITSQPLLHVLRLCHAFHPVFLVTALLFLLWGIIDTCIVFSHWKMQSLRETEVNDVFDVYAQIIRKIRPFRKHQKQIIIVEDLDRIAEKSIILGFLRELYRFQTIMQGDARRFAFIVSIKPEVLLTGAQTPQNTDDAHVYTKLFDVTIPLKPIHYDDYDSILLELFQKNPEDRKRFEEITGETITDHVLPKSFLWIKKGENLTLRDLKDRINRALMIMATRKSYKVKTAVNFEACAAVTYLESRYPKDYYTLIQHESAFAALMSQSVHIINKNDAEDALAQLKETCQAQYAQIPLCEEFIDDLCTLIFDGVFNYDFRMYFYTYPMGSHIKTTEERALCNLLLIPSRYRDYSDLDRITAMVYADGDKNVVTDTLETLHEYPEVVLMNETLLRLSCDIDVQKTAEAVNTYIIEPVISGDPAVAFWTRVHQIDAENKTTLIRLLKDKLIAAFSVPETIIGIRSDMIRAFGEDIPLFLDLFLNRSNPKIPQISAEEIRLIDNTDISISLIDTQHLAAKDFETISALLCSKPLRGDAFSKALHIMRQFSSMSVHSFPEAMLRFLHINHYADPALLQAIYADCDRDALLEYFNAFDPATLSDEYLAIIDDVGFDAGLSEGILQRLAKKNTYRCILMHSCKSEDFELLDSQLAHEEEILNHCAWISEEAPAYIPVLRQHLCVALNRQQFFPLYDDPFPLITRDEYISFDKGSDAIRCINIEAIDEDNYGAVLDFLYERTYSPAETLQLLNHLFDPAESADPIASHKTLFSHIVSAFHFPAIGVPSLTMEDRETVYKLVQPGFALLKTQPADRLRALGCLIPSVEKSIAEKAGYMELVSELDEATPYTLEWMNENYIATALSEKLCNALFENEDYENYITASVLRENNMILDNRIPHECYLNVYLNVPEMYDIMSDHWDFLESLQNSEDLKKLSKSSRAGDLIPPIYKVPQHSTFFRFILDGDFSSQKKMAYLDSIGKFASEADSHAFQILICQPKQMELMGDQKRYWRIWHNFWNSSHKGVFTRKWNERWKDEVEVG